MSSCSKENTPVLILWGIISNSSGEIKKQVGYPVLVAEFLGIDYLGLPCNTVYKTLIEFTSLTYSRVAC